MFASISNRFNTFLLVLLVLMAGSIIAILASRAYGGPLDPAGPPASTMKSLDDIPPAWDQTLSASGADSCNTERFKCVMGGTAVLDRETGLVWERNPSLKGGGPWVTEYNICMVMNLGGRSGWRPATEAELVSLLDLTQLNPAVSLPAGHPFQNVGAGGGSYWTATEAPDDATSAYAVNFLGPASGFSGNAYPSVKSGLFARGWCVRGAVTQ